jgi:solute carrier family 66 (lysosomal lysine-arginine transporter), member 1
MYMFVFAFLGNSFYVASIVLSPEFLATPPASTAYIKESIPCVYVCFLVYYL